MKPKILIDSISLLSSLTGIGRYTYEISKYLKDKDDLELNYFYGYYSNQFIDDVTSTNVKTLKSFISKAPLLKKVVRKIIYTIGKYYSPTYDLYWQPNFIPNDGIKAKYVVTSVHDFSFILHRDFHPKERIDYFDKYFFKNIYQSSMIITGSEYSKQEILERLDFKEDKIKVIYHGINHSIFKRYDEVNLNFEIPEKFILSVGSIEPRKNLLGLLNAYNLLHSDIKSEYKLVLVGFKGWGNSEIMELINTNQENIHYLGFITDEELAKVYNLASCFVFPSFYEGFGLPPLEAMACGTPVIASNSTSIPEVCADAATYCDPYDVNDIKVKIELLLSDVSLQNEMIQKGFKRAGEFTWEKSANQHLKVFKEVLQS